MRNILLLGVLTEVNIRRHLEQCSRRYAILKFAFDLHNVVFGDIFEGPQVSHVDQRLKAFGNSV